MKRLGAFLSFFLLCWCANGVTRYVDIGNTSPEAPYTSWITAATNIQDAVDAAVSGDTVTITNGHYMLSSEILVADGITIQSMNGPEATIIDGGGLFRGLNLGNNACILGGLTITNGYSSNDGGGIYCEGTMPIVTNCIISGNHADSRGGGIYNGTAINCTISENRAFDGGGLAEGTAKNCVISGNNANHGGGILCVESGSAYNCAIFGNSATYGGGIYCVFSGSAFNCTIIGNSASYGGGVSGLNAGSTHNCVIWYNNAPVGRNLYPTEGIYTVYASYCCSPDVTHGLNGNITNAPALLSTTHLAPDSPCRAAGSKIYATGSDIDGEEWMDPPSIGCDEYHGMAVGTIQVAVDCTTNLVVGYRLPIQGIVEGAVSHLLWDFDDGTFATNTLYPEHSWTIPGTYELVLSAYNDTFSSGVSATQTVEVAGVDDVAIYVATNGHDMHDGSSWDLAKVSIQAGVDAQKHAGGLVWIGGGTYMLSTEIVVDRDVVIQSDVGPDASIVDGQGVTRCFNLGNQNCTISGLTVTNGYSAEGGGGIYCAGQNPYVTNCVIIGNNANFQGGGMHAGTVDDCIISGNFGEGIYGGTANYCSIIGNSNGGMSGGMANHCLISDNEGSGMSGGTANDCTISGNGGSGMAGGTATRCTISGNSGGGMVEGIANNCLIIGNSANDGGGVSGYYIGTANNCLIIGNSATNGGGTAWATANNCTIVYNSATDSGGGMWGGYADNCIVWYNQAPSGGNIFSSTVSSSCSPELANGVDGNITNTPLFVDHVGLNYRLMASSPCLNAGSNSLVVGLADLDGNSRIIGPYVDMGAYEYIYDNDGDEDADGMKNEWEYYYFGSIVGANPDDDSDYDFYNNYSEYIAGTDPFDAGSLLACSLTKEDLLSGLIIKWSSVPGRWYKVLWTANLTNSFESLVDFIEYPQNCYTDTFHTAESASFYKVEVHMK